MSWLVEDIVVICSLLLLLSKVLGRTGAVPVDGGLTVKGLLVEDGRIRRPGR